MFWGWYSSGGNGFRRGGGCLFLPFLFIYSSLFMFDNFNSSWLMPVILGLILWFAVSTLFNRQPQPSMQGNGWDTGAFGDEKPKRDFGYDKPKRQPDLLYRDDGDVLEVIDPPDAVEHPSDDETRLL